MNGFHPALLTDPSHRFDPSTLIRLMNGKPVDGATLRSRAQVLACGNQLPTSNALYGFESDEDFQAWCEGQPIADGVHRAYRGIRRVQEMADADMARMETSIREAVESKDLEMQRLAQREKAAENSREAFLAAAGHPSGPPTPRILGIATLYEDPGFFGKVRTTPVSIPNLSWIGMNDKVSAVRILGAGFLAEKTLFRGKKFFMFGIPSFELDDLRLVDFDNIASSVSLFA